MKKTTELNGQYHTFTLSLLKKEEEKDGCYLQITPFWKENTLNFLVFEILNFTVLYSEVELILLPSLWTFPTCSLSLFLSS